MIYVASSRSMNRAEAKVRKGSRFKVRVPEGSVVTIIGLFARRGKVKGGKH